MHDTTVHRARLILRANAIFSTVTGAIAVVAADWVSDSAGIDHVVLTRLVGVGLLLFAADLVRQARLPESKLPFALLQTSVADLGWVLATPVVIAVVDLTRAGTIGALAIAAVVLDIALAQLWVRSKLVSDDRIMAVA
ncbi:MAG: hypothetical protein AAF081_12860 [Actinomycetota bacterium]